MRRMLRRTGLLVPLVVVPALARAQDAELGDINGDGRVSFADAHVFGLWTLTELDRWRPAAGSFEELGEVFPCTASDTSPRGEREVNYELPKLVHQEALRRASADPLPHFIERWPAERVVQGAAPAPDPRVEIELAGAQVVGSFADRGAEITLRLVTQVPLNGLQLVFRAQGLDLKPSYEGAPTRPPGWQLRLKSDWYYLTGGSVVFPTDIFPTRPLDDPPFLAGEYLLELPVELPAGAEPGAYQLEILAGTEAVIDDRAAVVPVATAGVLDIERRPGGGSLPFPELVFIEDESRIDGQFEMRVTGGSGEIGDEVVCFVEVRTDRPVNEFYFSLNFLRRKLRLDDYYLLWENPIAQRFVEDDFHVSAGTPEGLPTGWLWLEYHAKAHSYVYPFGEWLPFVELHFTILEEAAGSEAVTLNLFKDPQFPGNVPAFEPYRGDTGCGWDGFPSGWENAPASFQTAEIVILDDSEPPPPPPPPMEPEVVGLRVALGEATASPGDIVGLPVTVESAVDLWQLRFVLGFDPALLEPVGFDVEVIDPDGNHTPPFRLDSDDLELVNDVCRPLPEDPDELLCIMGLPALAILHGEPRDDVPNGHLVVDLITTFFFGRGLFYPGPIAWESGTRHAVGSALFRVREGVTAERIEVHGAEIAWFPEGAPEEVTSVTSGNPLIVPRPDRPDVPAIEVTPGVIHVGGAQGPQPTFLRGDADLSRVVELTDVIFALNGLFLAGPNLPCADAADTNDDGVLDVTDAVYELTYLYLEGPEPAAPFPEPGTDATADDLDCTEGLIR